VPEAPSLPTLPKVVVAPVAQVRSTEGQVRVERALGAAGGAEVKGPVFPGDTVVTGPASFAVLVDGAGRELEVGEDTRFTVGETLTTIEVLDGEFRFSSASGADGGVSVKTPFGRAELPLGAGGVLRVIDGGLTAEVLAGHFIFFERDAGARDVPAGQTFEVTAGSFTFAPTPRLPVQPEVKVAEGVKLVVELGRPLIKRSGQKKFVVAKTGEVLEPGTTLQTPAGASARLTLAHLEVVVPAGASGVTEGVRADGTTQVLTLSRFIGPMTLQLDGKGPARVDLGDAVIGGLSQGSVVVSQVGKKRRVEVKAGEVAVTVNGKSTTVKAGDAVLVDAGGAVAAPQSRPGLVVSASSKVRVYAEGLKDLALLFPGERNRVQVSRDADFATPFIQGQVGTEVAVPAVARGPLFFRTLDEAGQPLKAGRIDFLPDLASARDTATRSDVVAETGQKATVFFQSKVPALTFLFTPQEGAKAFWFRLYRAGALGSPVVEQKTADTRLVLEPGVLEEGEFLWSAAALDGSGVEKTGGRMNKLSVVYDNARTSLLIEKPLTGDRAGADVKAVGVAPQRSQLFINGKVVRPDDSGRFSVPVGPVDAVLFKVVSGDTESHWVRRLRR